MRIWRHWRRLGRLPSLTVFVVFYAVSLAIGLLLHGPVDMALGLALFGLFIAYCAARPDNRLDVFLCAAAPGAIGTMLHDLADISRLWGLTVLPITLWALREIDRSPPRECSPPARGSVTVRK